MKLTFKVRAPRRQRPPKLTLIGPQAAEIYRRGRPLGDCKCIARPRSILLTTVQITQVKAKVQELQGWEPSTLKFIYSGKVLQDDKTVASYNIEEKGFIVCMTQKVGLGASIWKLCLTCL
jgi:hypothetical protein